MTYDNFVLLRQQLVSSFKKESIVMLERFVNTHGNNGEFFFNVRRSYHYEDNVHYEPSFLYIDEETGKLKYTFMQYINGEYVDENDIEVENMEISHIMKLLKYIALDKKLFRND